MSTRQAGKQRVAKRDPFATSLAKQQYRQQRIPDKRHAKRQKIERRDLRQEGDEC